MKHKKLAKQAGFDFDDYYDSVTQEDLERFAELVRQDERAARGAALRKQDEQIREMYLTNARLFEKFNKAVLAEREACALLCEEWYLSGDVAKAIRARGNE